MFNHRGELQIALSAWWFFILFFISGGIIISASVYYSTDLDIKWLESDVLNQRILDCVSENSYLIENIFNEEVFYEVCNLDKDKFGKGSNYFFKIWVDDELVFGGGDYSIEKNCEIIGSGLIAGDSFPACSESEDLILDNGFEKVRVLTGSNQNGEVVPGV